MDKSFPVPELTPNTPRQKEILARIEGTIGKYAQAHGISIPRRVVTDMALAIWKQVRQIG